MYCSTWASVVEQELTLLGGRCSQMDVQLMAYPKDQIVGNILITTNGCNSWKNSFKSNSLSLASIVQSSI
jgi:hypothetical protein